MMPIAPDLSGIALDGRYELHTVIGEGAFGRVYRGRDRRLHRPVAVKVIKPWWAEDPDWVASFEREAQLLARVDDPGIVRIYDVGHAREGLYYVSELVDGEDLAQRLRRAAPAGLGVAEARAVALGLCRALAGAHAQRIVHRDVKPANVLLAHPVGGSATEARVKVGDFGVARLAGGSIFEHHPSVVVGTPKYMAPEQGRGLATTPATDVYAVGVVLYEMLAGRPPFTGDSPVALALAHLHEPPPALPRGVPAELRRVVARALAKDPADRYADARVMGAALQRAESREPSVATGAANEPTLRAPRRAPRIRVDPPARRRAIALLSLAGAVLGALIGAAVLTAGDHHAAPARAAARPPVEVPLLIGEDATDAQAQLRARGLHTTLVQVPAPGITPGTVTSQAPVAGATTPARSAVRLSVSEVPRWRPVTTVTGRTSALFRIRGTRWRIVSSVSDARHCTLFVFCTGTHAQVLRSGAAPTSVGLSDGGSQTRVFNSGPGTYQVTVSPASSATRWSLQVQDDY